MSFLQIAVVDRDCYQLLTDGTAKQLILGSNTACWKVIDQNPDNVQIVANAPAGLRRVNGDVFKFRGGWAHFGTNATKLWGWKGGFWQWQKGSGKLWYEGPETQGIWEIRDTNPLTKDLVVVQDAIYQLLENGNITQYQSPMDWAHIDDIEQTTAITTDHKSLYKLQKKGYILRLDGQQWQLIGNDVRTVQLAGGEAGLFQRHNDGKIYKHLGGSAWELSDPSPDNIYLAVASSAYRVNSLGEIYILDESGTWRLLSPASPQSTPAQTGVQPEQVYDGGYHTTAVTPLRIGNGGAGQSGLIKALADAFIQSRVADGFPPFKVAWYKSDTTESIKYLKDGVVDVAITYTPVAENTAIKEGVALTPSHYIFREHFLLVGPPANPARLNPSTDVVTQFTTLYTAADAEETSLPVRFLSRFDKSATNIKESELWVKIGQAPWATKRSSWYHEFIAFPVQALEAAAALQEYTLTDWGTYLSVDTTVQQQLVIYKRGSDEEDDTLLLPAHLLVGSGAQDLALANDFAAWVSGMEGQAVIANFQKNGHLVYSPAPQY